MNYHFACIPVNLISVLWSQIEQHVERVVNASAGEITTESVKARALSGCSTIIAVIKDIEIIAVNTVEVTTYDSGLRCLEIPVVGGHEAFEWGPDFLELCNQLAVQERCQEMRGFSTRTSWLKVLKPFGWEESHFVIKRIVE